MKKMQVKYCRWAKYALLTGLFVMIMVQAFQQDGNAGAAI